MLRRLLIAPIRFYQRFLSPLKPVPTCRYLPTCSSYAIEAIERRGIIVGSLKALWRLLRCNPLFPGGYDPVVRPELTAVSDSAEPDQRPERPSRRDSQPLLHRANCDHSASRAHEPLDIESVSI